MQQKVGESCMTPEGVQIGRNVTVATPKVPAAGWGQMLGLCPTSVPHVFCG